MIAFLAPQPPGASERERLTLDENDFRAAMPAGLNPAAQEWECTPI
jgi:hypothetical protein